MAKEQTLVCPICASQMEVHFHGDQMDKQAVCPACGHKMDVPDSFQRTKVTKTTRKSLFGSTTVEEVVAEERSDFDRNAAPSSPRTKAAPTPQPSPQVPNLGNVVRQQAITVDMSKMSTSQAKGGSGGCWVFAILLVVFMGIPLIASGGVGDLWNSIRNVASGGTQNLENARPVPIPVNFATMRFSPDGSILAASDENGGVYFLDASDYRVLGQFTENPFDSAVSALAFNADGTRFATGNGQGDVRIWDTATFTPLHYLNDGYGAVSFLEFSADDQYIVAGNSSSRALVWELPSGKLKNRLETEYTYSMALQPNSTTLAVGQSEALMMWDIVTGKIGQIYKQDASVESLDFSPDGRYLAFVSSSQVIVLDGNNKWKKFKVFEQKNEVFGPDLVTFSPGGRYVAVGDFFSKTYIWEVESGNLKVKMTELNEPELVMFDPDGKSVITVGGVHNDDNLLRVWDDIFEGDKVDKSVLETTTPLAQTLPLDAFKPARELAAPTQLFPLELETPQELAMVGDTLLAAPNSTAGIYWLDSTTGEVKARVALPNNDYVSRLSLSPDGSLIAASPYRNNLYVFDVVKQKLVKSLKTGGDRGVEEVIFSYDNSLLITLDDVANITIWDTATWQKQLTIDQDTTTYTYDLTISPDNKYIATSYSEDNIIFVYEVETGALVASLTHPNTLYRFVEFTPDGRYLLVTNSDGLMVLDVQNEWRPVANLDDPLSSSIEEVRVTPDSKHVITAVSNNQIFVWSLETFRLEWALQDGDEIADVTTNADGTLIFTTGGRYDPAFNTGLGNQLRVWDLRE